MKGPRCLQKYIYTFLAMILCISWLPANSQNALAKSSYAPDSDPLGTGSATPAAVFAGEVTLLTVVITPGTDPASTGLEVNGDLSTIGGLAAQVFYDDATNGDVTAGDNTFSFQVTVSPATLPGVKNLPITILDAQGRSAATTINLVVKPPLVPIHTIQGAAHLSPMLADFVTTQGIVTALRSNGFFMQDPVPDSDVATSEGIFVFTSSAPSVLVGDLVEVVGTVLEFRPGGSSSANLTTTELGNPGLVVTVVSSGNPLPAATVIGAGGRVPPNLSIENDATGDVELSGVFDPDEDGIDFYESLEGMFVQVNNPVVVGPTNSFGEIPVLADDGANIAPSLRTGRGGIIIQPDNFNSQRIILDDVILQPIPMVNVGDHFTLPVVGVMDYSFGNFKLLVTQLPVAVPGGLAQEISGTPPVYQLHVGTFNVENLAPTDPPEKFNELAGLIVNNLNSPDLVAIEEIQDNNGATNDTVVDANTTWDMLIAAIQAMGGPTYQYRQINPVDDQDGGAPGGNIRQGFLFRTDRGLAFVDRPGGLSTNSTAVSGTGSDTQLTFSPGRIDPANLAFFDSRKPLAGEFTFKGDKVFVVANHFNSKGGDNPLFGRFQPPVLLSEVQRMLQAQVVHDFADSLLVADPNANVIVLGDLNDFHFSNPIQTLIGTILNNLIETLPVAERYTYVFDGNSEDLDHILVSNPTFARPFEYDVVHVNAEFADQASDHEPQAAMLCVDATPPELTLTADPDVLWPPNHKYVTVTTTVEASDNADPDPSWSLVSVTSSEADNGKGDGNTTEDLVIVDDTTFMLRAERSGLGDGRVYAITYRAVDACGNSAEGTVVVYVPHDMGLHLRGLRMRYPQNTPLPIRERRYLYPYITFDGMVFLPMIKR
ncbi:MAG: hypothetical protein A2W35_18615 [Chloroflexi bacterium RBG_16_57_11]|nr:MAG: hypothetical protein A2W35_18615 [Chloroflexi bacterium RBG_16_57_11]